MKRGYDILGIYNIFGRFPGPVRGVVANPVHEILQFAAPKSRIEDRMDFKLRKAVHLDGKGDLHDAARERVLHM